ncbi:uncharacterized protein LOC117297450 isoform X2 [Asterias rubens]|uniref:uncharacterized protein LOC117297450 isoform X1 n=1 Tax=Asterias rubens TaxID=7604 RepID=UPI001455029E|nr:uncharacterized protein LOC117297450 isoform X1 [Asterias rubens]XP_033636383.1 uncharacterized protein LOC117297450 isoform X2 [Asterias rubens]
MLRMKHLSSLCFILLLLSIQVSDGETVNNTQDGEGNQAETSHQAVLPIFNEAILSYYVRQSIHHPACVLFKEPGSTSQLETQIQGLWKRANTQRNDQFLYRSWRLGSFLNQSRTTRGVKVPDTLPCLQCFIGTAVPATYNGPGKARDLHQWFAKQVAKLKTKVPEYSEAAFENLQEELVLIVLVDTKSHFDVELQVIQIKRLYSGRVGVLMVHPGSKDIAKLMKDYKVAKLPFFVIIEGKEKNDQTKFHKFEGTESVIEDLKMFLSVRMSSISILTMDNFESDIIRPKVKRSPTLVCFHAPWGRDTSSYLDAFKRSAAEFLLEDGSGLGFGLVDIHRHAEVVTRWVDATYAKSVPFSVLFWWKEVNVKGLVLQQKVFPNITPTPWAVASVLEQSDVAIYNGDGEELQYSPWAGKDDHDQISYGFTSYTPQSCTTSANMSLGLSDIDTDVDICSPSNLPKSKSTNVKSRKPLKGNTSWIKKSSSAASAKPNIAGVDKVTDSKWSSIIERSDVEQTPLRLNAPWRQDVASTTLVVFIQNDCSNCLRKMAMFGILAKSVKMIDGGSMYIMNCTSDPTICSQLHVIGFPTLIAFRGYGEIGSEHCVTPGQATQLIRMDYHGVLEEKLIMEWFSEISVPAVTRLPNRQTFRQSEYQKDDVVLLATMYPLSLAGKYLPTLSSTSHWYPLECYQVACERLYGRANCLAVLTENLERRDVEKSRQQLQMVVTQIEMFRKDGIQSVVFSLGRNLMATLQDESHSQIHAFHSPHRYNLKEGQHCEDDVASCTDLIVEFVQDHGRLPVTHLTLTGFHTHSGAKFGEHHENSIFEHDLPVLIALANKGHLMDGAQFIEALTSAAYELYNKMVFVSINTDEFPKWASRFVPLGYRQKVLDHSDQITQDFLPSLNVYPRLCIVRQDDHRHAAMFPSGEHFTLAPAHSPRVVTKTEILTFAGDFLRHGDSMMLQTEQF